MEFSKCNALAVFICLISVAAFAFFRSQEGRIPPRSRLDYRASGWIRECVEWDPLEQRFIVSFFEGGLGQVRIPESGAGIAQEEVLVKDPDLKGNTTLGFKLDSARQRVLVVASDGFGFKYSSLAAYDTKSWKRIFLTQLGSPERLSHANDVAFDPEGNAYVTDSFGGLIWRVSSDGASTTILTDSPEFKLKPKTKILSRVGLNGIVYHPEGYLLVAHTSGDAIFKVSKDGKQVSRVGGDEVRCGDGIVLVSSNELAVAGLWTGVRLVESLDGWLTARVKHHYEHPKYRMGSSVTLKDDVVFVSFLFGYGIPYTHTITEASFVHVPSSSSAL